MNELRNVGLEFSEKMSGYFTEGEIDFWRGFEIGEEEDNDLSFNLTISIEDIADFIKLSGRKARLEGTFSSRRFGDNLEIRNGEFNLFSPSRITGKREMVYSFGFTGDDGEDYFFHGHKVIYDDPGIDLPEDMTTLFTRIYRGDSDDGVPIGSGILRFRILDVPSWLASFRAINASSLIDRIRAIYKFHSFCYGELRDTYLDKLSPIYYTHYENLILSGEVALEGKDPQEFFFVSGIHDKDFPWGDGEIFWDVALIVKNGDGEWDRFMLTDRNIEGLILDVDSGTYQYEGEIYQIIEGNRASFTHLKKPTLPDHLKQLRAKIEISFRTKKFETMDLPYPMLSEYKRYVPDSLVEDVEELADQLGALGLHLTPYTVTVTGGSFTIFDEDAPRTYEIQKEKTFGQAEKSSFNNVKKPTLDYDYICALNAENKHVYIKIRSGALRESRKDYLVDKIEEHIGKIIGQNTALDMEIRRGRSRILPEDKRKDLEIAGEDLLLINNDHFPTGVFKRRIVSVVDNASGEKFNALVEDMDTLNLSGIDSSKVVKVAAIKDPDKFRALDSVLETTEFFEKLDRACEQSRKDKESFAIIVKPNFMFTYNREDISTYTDPALVDYLIDRIHERGYRNLAVAEARSTYGTFFTNREVVTVARYIGLSEKNYRIIDLSENLIPYEYSGLLGQHYVNPEWANADFRISFAKNKTHSYAYYTLTIKNIYGALPCEDKFQEYHCKRDIYSTTVEYIRHFPIHFGLIDASVSADGPFGIFADRDPNFTETIIGGEDIIAVDWIGAYKMGLDPMESEYVCEAIRVLGKPEIDFTGDREIYPNWVNVPDIVSLTAFGLDIDHYFGNLIYSIFSYMDPFFEYKDLSVSKRFMRILAQPIKDMFFRTVRSGMLGRDFIELSNKLFRNFDKAAHGRGRYVRILLGVLAGAGLAGLVHYLRKRREV